jgi:hypothetical protein
MRILLTLFFFFTLTCTQAQTKADTGTVTIKQDDRVKEMLQKYSDSRNGKMKGYRVQIHFGAEKIKAKDVKSKFLTKYPDTHAYDFFETPYFKVRVGDFRTRLEAYKFLKQIENDFPGAFIVADEIELPAL